MNASQTLTALPFLTADVPPIRAAIKRRYEDFVVEEIPAYEPIGHGDHCYFKIEKRGLATMRAVNDVSRALGIPTRDIGLAGLKDARAVAIQTLSIEHIDPARIEAMSIPRIKVLSISRHTNKLKIGHLFGNRFRIKLRDVDPARIDDMRAICDVLAARGAPNYFGQQRFGIRGDTWQIGRATLKRDAKEVVDLVLGRAGPHDTGEVLRARKLYDAGKYEAAASAWPYGFRDNARACRAMAKSGGKHVRAFHALDIRIKKFFVNAYQSYLFNQVVAARVSDLDRVYAGDLAYKHDNGAVFRVEDEAAEAPRAAAFEISATGPIFGFRMTQPEGRAREIEDAVLSAEGTTLEDFRGSREAKFHGSRRPIRFAPEQLELASGSDEHGPFIELEFTLPSGCYATMILRETCKEALEEGLEEDSD
ncbi:MAG TPA: tRNA pseudouridine(13) synthase TruD [Phycisphaerae bacterium]|nr:tRNA pseudouridine(13) synthase TruD [Phycisphaerae bacterium]